MKKIVLWIVLIVSLVGIGILGYVIFNAKSIDSVVLEGNMQSLYFVNDEIDYEDAKLKVTYKNGSIKMLNLDSDGVKVTNFSTSTIGDKNRSSTLNIIYKDFKIDVDYLVISKGSYYVSSEATSTYENMQPTTNNYSKEETNCVLEFLDGGKLKYFIKNADENWYLEDGRYDDRVKYEIISDKIKVNVGEDSFEIKAIYDDKAGVIDIMSTKKTYDESGEFIKSIKTTDFKWFKTRDNIKLQDKPTIDYSLAYSNLTLSEKSTGRVDLSLYDTIASSGKIFYAKVVIDGGVVAGDLISTYYVRITDAMFGSRLKTDMKATGRTDQGEYCGKSFDLYYNVV